MAKKLLGILGGTTVGLIVLFFVVGLFLPKEFKVERSILVEAPVDLVFPHVADLTKNEAWMPWNKDDPTMKITWGDKTMGEGAWYSWTSDESGDGKLTTVSITENARIVNDLEFAQGGPAQGIWAFENRGDSTYVTWAMVGKAQSVPQRYFGMMADSMAGPQFEIGLSGLKEIVEEEAASIEADEGIEDGEVEGDEMADAEGGEPG